MDFLVNIVHELRTPVFLISAPLEELVSSGKRIVQAPLSYVRSIYENALRLNKLIDRIIDFRKIESVALELQLKRFDAVAYCKDLSEGYARLCPPKVDKNCMLMPRTLLPALSRLLFHVPPRRFLESRPHLLSYIPF